MKVPTWFVICIQVIHILIFHFYIHFNLLIYVINPILPLVIHLKLKVEISLSFKIFVDKTFNN